MIPQDVLDDFVEKIKAAGFTDWYSTIELFEFPNKFFNGVCFEEV